MTDQIKDEEIEVVENENGRKVIPLNEFIEFDVVACSYIPTNLTSEIMYRKKNLICSYSGTNEWAHHFMCELLDVCTGSSIYNYCIGCCKHEEEFNKLRCDHSQTVLNWVSKSRSSDWGKVAYDLFSECVLRFPDRSDC